MKGRKGPPSLPKGEYVGNRDSLRGISAALTIGAAVFLLNDAFLSTENAISWIVLDYGSRSLVVGICLYAAPFRQLHLTRPRSLLETAAWAAMMLIGTIVTDHLLRQAFPAGGIFSYPALQGRALLTIDTVVGIPLVAVSEEVLSRGLFLAWASQRGWRSGTTVVASAALFAAFHWSLGPASILVAAFFGVLSMCSVLITRSLWPALAAHWLADLVLFSLPDWLRQ